METKKKNKDGNFHRVIVQYCKGGGNQSIRILPLSEFDIKIFEDLKKNTSENGNNEGDYVFCNEKGRISIRVIDNRIRNICKLAGLNEIKSAHDIRRTVASNLARENVKLEVIRDFIGHSDLKTTLGYIYNLEEKETINKQLEISRKGLNGLKID